MKQLHLSIRLGLVVALLAAVVALPAANPVLAGVNLGPKVALHVSAMTTKEPTICSTWNPNELSLPCSAYNTRGDVGQDLLVYLVVARADTPSFAGGVAGITAGIEYDGRRSHGIDVLSWTVCADGLDVPNSGPGGEWPASGGGDVITWLNCQQSRIGSDGIHAVVGAFRVYAYSSDKLRITPNRNLQVGPQFLLANCFAQEFGVDDTTLALGSAGFGMAGFNPCGELPVVPATWGSLKTKY
jgi:hypothetical protein